MMISPHLSPKSLLFVLLILFVSSACQKEVITPEIQEPSELCFAQTEIAPPPSRTITELGSIEFPGNVRDIHFPTPEIGYARGDLNAGSYSVVFKTTDGGITWEDTELEGSQRGYDLVFYDERFGVLGAYSRQQQVRRQPRTLPLLWITEDGGENWEKTEIDIRELDGTVNAVTFDEAGNLYVLISQDSERKIAISTDRGNSWELFFDVPEPEGTVWVNSIGFHMVEDQIYLNVGGDVLVVGTDGRIARIFQLPGDLYVRGFQPISGRQYVVYRDGIYRSTNGGVSWTTLEVDAPLRTRPMAFLDSERGYQITTLEYCPSDVGPSIDVIAYTEDGGESFEFSPETPRLNSRIQAVEALEDGSLLVAARNQILRFD